MFYRWIAALLLLVYTTSGTSVLPATVAFLASFDEAHQSQVQQTSKGFQVLLKHSTGRITPRVQDHQAGLARLVVSFCHSQQNGDHEVDSTALAFGIFRLQAKDDTKGSKSVTSTHALLGLEKVWLYLPQARLVSSVDARLFETIGLRQRQMVLHGVKMLI